MHQTESQIYVKGEDRKIHCLSIEFIIDDPVASNSPYYKGRNG